MSQIFTPQTSIIGPSNIVQSITDFDDFIGSNVNSKLEWDFKNFVNTNGTQNNPGLVLAQVNSGNAAVLTLSSSIPTQSFELGAGSLTLNWIMDLVSLSTVTNAYTILIGISDADISFGSGLPQNGCFFRYSNSLNLGNWQCITRSAGISTTTNSSVPPTLGFHAYTVQINSNASQVIFYIDGIPIVPSNSSNIPLSPIDPCILLNCTNGSSPSQLVDLFYYNQTLTNTRPGLSPSSGQIVGGGDITGPDISTDDAIVRWDGNTGKIIQNSLVTIDDDGNVDGIDALIMNGELTVGGDVNFTGDGDVFTISTRTQFLSGIRNNVFDTISDTLLGRDEYICACFTRDNPIEVEIEDDLPNGSTFIIKDIYGNASVNNITIVITDNTFPIDGQSSYVINQDFGSVQLFFDGAFGTWGTF